MNTKVIIASFVGAVASFFMGWVIYGMLLMDTMMANTINYEGLMYKEPIIWALFLSGWAWCFLIAYIYEHWSNTRSFMPGFKNGIIIAAPIMLGIDLGYYAFFNLFTTQWLCMDVVIGILFNAVVSGIIAAVLGRGQKAAA